MQYQKEPPANKSRMQCYATTQTYALYLNNQMLTITCIKNQMRLFKLTTPDTHHTSDLLTQNWTLILMRMHCIHYASSLYGKIGNEMTGRFNQDLPENLHAAFEKMANFEPCIITKQSIHERKVHEVNQIDVSQFQNEVEINEAHVRNPNYKGKNYDPNYQQNRNKQYPATNTSGSNYKNGDNQHNTYNKPCPQGNNYNSQGNNYQKNTFQDKPANVSVT